MPSVTTGLPPQDGEFQHFLLQCRHDDCNYYLKSDKPMTPEAAGDAWAELRGARVLRVQGYHLHCAEVQLMVDAVRGGGHQLKPVGPFTEAGCWKP